MQIIKIMKKTIKGILLVVVCALCVTALASCWFKKDSSAGDQNSSDEVVYSLNTQAVIILGEGISRSDVSPIKSAYFETVGKDIYIINSDTSKSSHEIIVGKNERELSVKAYRALELTERNEGDVGYVIYSDGKSVAIAFDDASFGENVALATAVEDFVTKYMTNSTLKLNKGLVCRDIFDPIEKQAPEAWHTFQLNGGADLLPHFLR